MELTNKQKESITERLKAASEILFTVRSDLHPHQYRNPRLHFLVQESHQQCEAACAEARYQFRTDETEGA